MVTRRPAETWTDSAPGALDAPTGSGADAPRDRGAKRDGLHRRFDRVGRLVGEKGMERLTESHAMVVGVGGVGSFAAESLARSGVGELTLVDFDRVCVTNSNRQIQALEPTIGLPKVVALGTRLGQINPLALVRPLDLSYSKERADHILSFSPDVVVDAVDNITAKCHLLAECRKRGIPVVSSLGAAGRMDPTSIEVADLACSKLDPMARIVRKILRQKYEFPRRGSFGITAVYSREPAREPFELHYGDDAEACDPEKTNDLHKLDRRRIVYGSASFVTGTFGLFCASAAVRELLNRGTPE